MYSGKDLRLYNDWQSIIELCKSDNQIFFRVLKTKTGTELPTDYEITFMVKSITGILPNNMPEFGNKHQILISLPEKYPVSAPLLRTLSPVWHPNVKYLYHPPGEGHICVNMNMVGNEPLSVLVMRTFDIIGYQNYWAKFEMPFPEDLEVAKWVIEHGEPKGWVLQLKEENENKSQIDSSLDAETVLSNYLYRKLEINAEHPILLQEEKAVSTYYLKEILDLNLHESLKSLTPDELQFKIQNILNKFMEEGKIYIINV
jgi:hypothetical protein